MSEQPQEAKVGTAFQKESDVKTLKPGIDEALKKLRVQFDKKSPVIRALHANGYTRTQIKNAMGIRYQHVRNVLITPLTGKSA